jgi:hypothetical protein
MAYKEAATNKAIATKKIKNCLGVIALNNLA